MSDAWIAVYVTKRGGEVRFPLFEDENGKLFLKSSGESLPYQIGLRHPEHGNLVHFRTEKIPEQEKATTKLEEKA